MRKKIGSIITQTEKLPPNRYYVSIRTKRNKNFLQYDLQNKL